MILGTVLSKYVWTYTPSLAEASVTVGQVLAAATGATFSRQLAGTLVVMVGLSFVWGVVYHLARHS
jgi:hypothetical protein